MGRTEKSKLKKTAYSAAQWTWGLPQTLAGALLYLKHRDSEHFDYKGARATVWDRDEGVSLGKFIFVPRDGKKEVSDFLLHHEYGHTIQSLVLGPLYLHLIGAPSMLWNRHPYFINKRRKTGKSYYSVIFERTANVLGADTELKKHDDKRKDDD